MPTHLYGMNEKQPATSKRPNEIFYLDTNEQPFTMSIAKQIEQETEDHREIPD